ncbi:MAG TPA: hypothetical protein VMZ29_16970 [Candidatus Bathyarchaeia archaeon]|nr:hypothetical protein [Candidatus Bathyarchaeia archaeon]
MVVTTALGLTSGIYSIIIGIAIVGLWLMLIIRKQIPELKDEPITIYFHVTAEILMGILAILSGILIIIDLIWGAYIFLISSGLCIYAVINSAGYYAQRKTWIFVVLFATILIMSSTLSIFTILNVIV